LFELNKTTGIQIPVNAPNSSPMPQAMLSSNHPTAYPKSAPQTPYYPTPSSLTPLPLSKDKSDIAVKPPRRADRPSEKNGVEGEETKES
jgi:hypothetical protein